MNANLMWGLICGLLILLALEIRNRWIFEELARLRNIVDKLVSVIDILKNEMNLKKNIYDEKKP